jgi:hypothetical protein
VIQKNVVLVLGAGSNITYGFPSGKSLTGLCEINTELELAINREPDFWRPHNYKNSIKEFQHTLKYSQTSSIDALLEREEFQSEVTVGKALIAQEILKAEGVSLFTFFQPESKVDHWYQYLRNHLFNNVSRSEFKNNKLTIVTFNYDRSLEYYLARAYMSTYKVTESELGELFSVIKFIHVYGSLGKLFSITEKNIQYGYGASDAKIILKAAENIKIWNEDVDSSQMKFAKQAIENSFATIIIGYGYHPQNSERLGLREVRLQNAIAGYYNLFLDEINEITQQCLGFSPVPINDGSITNFLRQHAHNILTH